MRDKPTDRFNNRQLWYAGFLNNPVIVLEIIALIWVLKRAGGPQVLIYYTVISNLILLISGVLLAIWMTFKHMFEIPRWLLVLRYVAACMSTLTVIVVVAILTPMTVALGGNVAALYLGPNLFHHLICPIAMVISFIFLERRSVRMTGKAVIIAVMITIIYAAILTILNAANIITGPYPFLMVHSQSIGVSILWGVIVLLGSVLIALILRGRGQKKKSTNKVKKI